MALWLIGLIGCAALLIFYGHYRDAWTAVENLVVVGSMASLYALFGWLFLLAMPALVVVLRHAENRRGIALWAAPYLLFLGLVVTLPGFIDVYADLGAPLPTLTAILVYGYDIATVLPWVPALLLLASTELIPARDRQFGRRAVIAYRGALLALLALAIWAIFSPLITLVESLG